MSLMRDLYRSKLVCLTAIIVAAISIYKISIFLQHRVNKNDFAHYYLGSKIYLEGKNPYTVDLAPLYMQNGFVNEDILQEIHTPYPPFFLLLFSPLANLEPKRAFAVWVLIEVVFLSMILSIVRFNLGEHMTNRGWLIYCAAVTSSAWVESHFFFSQMGLMLAALVLLSHTFHRAGYYKLSLFPVTLAGLLKIFPFFFFPWFFLMGKASVKVRVAMAIIVTLSVAGVVLFTGLDNWESFFIHSLNNVGKDSVNRTANSSLPALIANLGLAFYDFSPSTKQLALLVDVGTGAGLILIGSVYIFCMQFKGNIDYGFSLISVAILAGSVRTFTHYFVFLIYPMAVALVIASSRSERQFLIMTICYLLLNFAWIVNTNYFAKLPINIFSKIAIGYMPLYGMILLIAYLFLEVLRSRECKTD
jgi:hypothetical protein